MSLGPTGRKETAVQKSRPFCYSWKMLLLDSHQNPAKCTMRIHKQVREIAKTVLRQVGSSWRIPLDRFSPWLVSFFISTNSIQIGPDGGHTPCTHRERHAGLGRWSRAASAAARIGSGLAAGVVHLLSTAQYGSLRIKSAQKPLGGLEHVTECHRIWAMFAYRKGLLMPRASDAFGLKLDLWVGWKSQIKSIP